MSHRFKMVCHDCVKTFGRDFQVTDENWHDSNMGNWNDRCQLCGWEASLKEVELIPVGCVAVEKELELV